MRAKLKTECGEFRFWRKLAIQLLVSFVVAFVHLGNLLWGYPEACLGEYIVYSLTETDNYYIMVLLPLLCLVWTSGRHNEAHRYPILIRYRNRNEQFCMRFLAKAGFLLAALGMHMGALLAVGNSLPTDTQFVYISSADFSGIISRQLLNIFCYLCTMQLVHEILHSVVGNNMLDTVLTTAVIMLNLVVVKNHLDSVMPWMPWGNIAYKSHGWERSGYHFYWYYWIFMLLLLFYLANKLNGRKDYVFEESRKVN